MISSSIYAVFPAYSRVILSWKLPFKGGNYYLTADVYWRFTHSAPKDRQA